MSILESLLIIGFAGLLHGSFQLSVSVLTLLSGHSLSRKHSHSRLVGLTSSFTLGVGIMTILLLSGAVLLLLGVFGGDIPKAMWVSISGLLGLSGVAVWVFYYRSKQGTTLWIPRALASYLHDRTKSTKHNAEAFNLGLGSVIAELVFIVSPIVLAALTISSMELNWQLLGVAIYTFFSIIGLLFFNGLIGGGTSTSKIQKWREDNKRFIQFASGAGLVVLGWFVYVSHIVSSTGCGGIY